MKKCFLTLMAVMLASVLVTGCATNQTATLPPGDFEDVIITLERTACKGKCPVYLLTVYGTGTVVYEGKDFVQTTGRQETAISRDEIKQLISEFERIDYFSLNDSYVERVITDAPSAITSLTLGGKTKTINH